MWFKIEAWVTRTYNFSAEAGWKYSSLTGWDEACPLPESISETRKGTREYN